MAKFNEEFFEGEYREGFYVESMMKRAWAAEIEVLGEIDKICKRHGIQYFADSGTLLGAVRHKGFIPWDDDIDIAMLREDYERFIWIAQKELPIGFIMGDARISPKWSSAVTCVINGIEIGFQNKVRLEKFHGFPFAAGVDIFPLDNLPSKKEDEKLQCQLLYVLQSLKNRVKQCKETNEEIESIVLQVETLFGVEIDRNALLENELQKLTDRICRIYEREETKEIANLYWFLEHTDARFQREWYNESILMPFETIEIPVPKCYDEILRVTFGDDYMIPKKMLQEHEYPFYKKQEQLWNEYVAEEVRKHK